MPLLWLLFTLGERAEALDELERALEQRAPMLQSLDTPFLPFTSLRGEPRYQKVLQDVSDHCEDSPELADDSRDGRWV